MSGFDRFDFGAVGHAGAHAIERNALIEIEDFHPRFQRAAHLFQQRVVDTIGRDGRQPVEHFKCQRLLGNIFERDLPHQSREVFLRHGEIHDVGLQADRLVDLLQFQLVHADEHAAIDPVRRREGFVKLRVDLEEGAKAQIGRELIGFVGGLIF